MNKLVLFFIILFFIPFVSAQNQIKSSENVEYLHADLIKTGSVFLQSTGFSVPSDLHLNILIPQTTNSQETDIISVEGPDEYNITKDKFGNQIMTLVWKRPPVNRDIPYRVVFDVKVYNKTETRAGNFSVTGLTRPSMEITKKAFEITEGLEGIYKIFKVTEWVNRWVEYDKGCMNFTKSAVWTYHTRKGTCDEFSNLLISMLRALGYNAWYVAGYAFSKDWGPHGWVEVEYNGRVVSLDPTWLESPVDATHIKFVNLPDSNQTETAGVLGNVKILWNKTEPEIKIVKETEKPKIKAYSIGIPTKIKSGSYGLLKIHAFSDKCVLSEARTESCKNSEGADFIELSEKNKTMGFCYQDDYYFFLKAPEIKKGFLYTCPVTVYVSGKKDIINFTVVSDHEKETKLYFNTQSVLTPGQRFIITTSLLNSGKRKENVSVYVFFNGIVQSKTIDLKTGETQIKWSLNAPEKTGKETLYIYSSLGDLASKDMTIIENKKLGISNITVIRGGDEIHVFVNVVKLSNVTGSVVFRVNGEEQREKISFGNQTQTFEFVFEPESSGTQQISIFLVSKEKYQDGWEGSIMFEKSKSATESVWEYIKKIINYFLSIFNIKI